MSKNTPRNTRKTPKITSKRLPKKPYEATVLPVSVSYSTLVDPKSDAYMLGYRVTANSEAKIFALRKAGHNI